MELKDFKTKPSRYKGPRFDKFDVQHKAILTEDFVEPEEPDIDIVTLLEGKGIKIEFIEVLLLRIQGQTFPDIGEKLGIKEDTARMRFERTVEKFGLDKNLLTK